MLMSHLGMSKYLFIFTFAVTYISAMCETVNSIGGIIGIVACNTIIDCFVRLKQHVTVCVYVSVANHSLSIRLSEIANYFYKTGIYYKISI